MCQIKLSVTVKQPSCITAIGHNYEQISDGSISGVVSNGVPPYTFVLVSNYFSYSSGSYSKIQSNCYFPGLTDGIYTLDVWDAVGQSIINDSIQITSKYQWPWLLANMKTIQPTGCLSNDGTIILSDTMGKAPYLYSIDGGNSFSSNNTFTNLTPGGYYVLSKDANGCFSSNTAFSEPIGLGCLNCCNISLFAGQISSERNTTSCQNEGWSHAIASKYSKDHLSSSYDSAFQFSNDGIHYHVANYSIFNGDSINNLPPGLYHYYVKDTITNESAVWAYTIGKSCYPYISFVAVDASCQQSDGALTVSVANGAPPYSYTMDGINYQGSNVFTGLAAGSYSIGVKDNNGDINYATATVYNKCPVIIASNTNDICDKGVAKIMAKGYRGTKPYSYSINGINFQSDSVFTGLHVNSYIVIIKDAKGFTDTSSVVIKSYCTKASAFAISETCGNKNGSINASGINGLAPYQYSIDGIKFNYYNIFSNIDSGSYLVTVKDANSSIDTVTVYVGNINGPSISVITDTALCNNTGGSIIISPASGSSPLQYSIDGLNFQSSNTFTNDTAGIYILRVKDANGCVTKDTVIVFKYLKPIVFLGDDTTLCSGQTFHLNANSGFKSYLWSNNSNASNIIVTAAGNYYVTVTDKHDCTVSDTINILYTQTPVFTLGNDTALCEKQTLFLQSNTSGNYLWQDGSTQKQIIISTAGLYWLQINNNNCIYRDSFVISYKPLPILHLPSDTILCNQNTLLLTAAQTNNTAVYLWQDGSAASNYLVTNEGTYMVKVTQNGCLNYETCIVQYQQIPQLNTIIDATKCKNESLLLDVSFPNSNYLWQDLSSKPTYNVNVQGNYYCSIINYCGAITDTFHVTDKICECTLIIPNAFSPNGDGINDVFRPNIDCVPSYYHMNIFDRNGHVVFSSNNISDYWNGTYQNIPVPVGTYYYILKVKGVSDPVTNKKSGSITILR